MIAYRQDSLARLFGINRVGSKKSVNTSKSWWALGGWISGKSVLICSEEFGNDQNQNTSGSKKLMTFYKCRFCFFTLKILLQPLMYPGTVENTNFLVTMGQFDLSAQTLPWEANLVSTDVSFWSGQGVHTRANNYIFWLDYNTPSSTILGQIFCKWQKTLRNFKRKSVRPYFCDFSSPPLAGTVPQVPPQHSKLELYTVDVHYICPKYKTYLSKLQYVLFSNI